MLRKNVYIILLGLTLFACSEDVQNDESSDEVMNADGEDVDETDGSGSPEEDEQNTDENLDENVDDGSEMFRDIEISFEALFNNDTFECGVNYENAGRDGASISPTIFQFYIHDIEVENSSGDWIAVDLPDDGVWQKDGIVLLDFDKNTGLCSGMTDATNKRIAGIVPQGDYTGVRFKLGVPAEKNNLDFSLSEAPLNNSLMFWGWMQGYRYLRLEFEATSSTYSLIHMGATSCTGNAFAGEVMDCEYPNRFPFELTGEDPFATLIQINVDEMLLPHDLGSGNLGLVCEAERYEPDCPDVFKVLGEGLGEQTFMEWSL